MNSVQENILVYLHNGYNVLTMDYRGFGKSTGKIITPELFLEESLLWYNYLKNKEENITIVGKSLGTGLATYVASKNTVEKLILITPYDSLHKVGKDKMPLLPVNFLMKYKVPAIKWIKDINCPIRIIHGTHDSTILPIRAENYYNECNNQNKDVKILWLKGAEHDNLHSYPEFFKEIENYLN
jgi:pimeloyl-ACP methyl ester carboxylesterase